MKLKIPFAPGFLALTLACASFPTAAPAAVTGWLSWRGPQQNGSSLETGLPDKVDPQHPLWSAELPGQSTPVIANGKLYIMGYVGDGTALQEGVVCFDAETGHELWRKLFSDFLSDTIYLRYATSSPTIDEETGNVYMQGTQGILAAFTADGKPLWQHSLMEEYGRLTFPNSRTASPAIDGDLVITRGITANWGANGPASDRFYAFDKRTGELVWSSTPGDRPKDNSFSHPVFGWLGGKRVLYSATGDGAVVCVNVRTGEPIWRIPLTKAGINSAVLVHDDKVISIYGTPYEPGQLIALTIPKVNPPTPEVAPVVVERKNAQVWADDISTSTSSPILVGDRVYVVSEKGDFCQVDAKTGARLGTLKLGIEERNSCPLFADGKLYVPMLDDPDVKTAGGDAGTKGALYIIKPGDKDMQIIDHVALDGRCFGTPTAYNGKVYIQTARKLYCFGKAGNNPGLAAAPAPEKWPAAGPAAQLQVIPSEILMRPGQTQSFRIRSLDANGFTVQEISDTSTVKFASYIPATAKVKSFMKAAFDAQGRLIADADSKPSAGAFEASLGNLKGYFRGRVLPNLPIHEDFEEAVLTETNVADGNALYSYPPLPWIGARFKFDIRNLNGNKVLAKTLDNPFFQRATVFIGAPSAKNYTVEADIMTEGTPRVMSEVGLVNQRYYIVMKGASREVAVNSTEKLFHFTAPFEASPNVWYHMKTRVDVAAGGSGVIRAKLWKKGDPEPDKWTIEVPDQHVHQEGSPGLFAFAPQKRVYIDNIAVTPNQ